MTQTNDLPRELSPYEAYKLSEQQKADLGKDFLHKLVRIYREAKEGSTPSDLVKPEVHIQSRNPNLLRQAQQAAEARQQQALKEFVSAVDQKLEDTRGKDEVNAVRLAYREIAIKYGLKQVDPTSPSFNRDLNEFHRNYVTCFPIPSEQESKAGFKELVKAPMIEEGENKGYKEVIYSAVCPFTNQFLMGVNFSIQPNNNAAVFTYGFVAPEARGAVGFSRPLVGSMTKIASDHIEKFPTKYPGAPLVVFEKNILGEMALGDILLDSAGINAKKPPREGVDLSRSSIDQSLRDLAWDRLGGVVVNCNYMQSSLDGVVKVDPKAEPFVIRYLNKDATLSDGQKREADRTLKAALGDKVEGCTSLALCVFAPADVKEVDAGRVKDILRTFQGISVVSDPQGIRDDIYFKACMQDIDSKTTADGKLSLGAIPAFSGPFPATGFTGAAKITNELLKHVTWKEITKNADRTYGEWLDIKKDEISASARPGASAFKGAATERHLRKG